MRIKEFKRPHEVELDPDLCFLAQGVICCGPATRAGCGLPCIKGNMPCRGCYGPPDGVIDQGSQAAQRDWRTDRHRRSRRTCSTSLDSIVDVVGTFYRFSLADSILSELKYR